MIDAADPDDDVVVVVEMVPRTRETAAAAQPRQQMIAQRRVEFEKQASPIEQAIHDIGGEVLDRAWINSTMKARIPAHAVKTLMSLDDVETVDVEHRLQRD